MRIYTLWSELTEPFGSPGGPLLYIQTTAGFTRVATFGGKVALFLITGGLLLFEQLRTALAPSHCDVLYLCQLDSCEDGHVNPRYTVSAAVYLTVIRLFLDTTSSSSGTPSRVMPLATSSVSTQSEMSRMRTGVILSGFLILAT